MKYKIKRPDLDRAIRALYKNPDCFDSEFNRVCANQLADRFNVILLTIDSDDSITGIGLGVTLFKSDIEEQPEYKPDEWNPYPEVKPPASGKYLVTVKCGYSEHNCTDLLAFRFFDGVWDTLSDEEVLAFKAMPEMYKPKNEEN